MQSSQSPRVALRFHNGPPSVRAFGPRQVKSGLRLTALLVAAVSLSAATRAGDALLRKARALPAPQTVADMDALFALARQALATDPGDIEYQLEFSRDRALDGLFHAKAGIAYRDAGKLDETLAEFSKSLAIDPANPIAGVEAERTRRAMKERAANPTGPSLAELLVRPELTQSARTATRFANAQSTPTLNTPLKPLPLLRVNKQPSSEVFAALAKLAGLKIFFDPDYRDADLGRNGILDFRGLSPQTALNYLASVTKSFWKPLAADSIFVTNDDAQKRALYEDAVTKVFYLNNITQKSVLDEIAGTLKSLVGIRQVEVQADDNSILVRSDAGRVALAEKLIADIDRPRAEVVIDVIFLSVDKDWVRNLGLQLGSSAAVNFAPSPGVATSAGGLVSTSLSALTHLGTGDFSVTLPGGVVSALLQTTGTKVLNRAQLRMLENRKAMLNSGLKVPYASSSFLPGGSGNVSALVNTQFTYLDVGFNLSVEAHVHEVEAELDLHVEYDVSSVASYVVQGGLSQPVLSQRKRTTDVRVKDGEVNFWDSVTQQQDNVVMSGTPGLSSIPGIGKFFTGQHRQHTESQILTLLVPHIIRNKEIPAINLAEIATGTDQNVRLSYPEPAQTEKQLSDEIVDVVATLPAAAAPSYAPGQPGGFPGQPGGFPGQTGGFPGQTSGFPGQTGGFPGQPNTGFNTGFPSAVPGAGFPSAFPTPR